MQGIISLQENRTDAVVVGGGLAGLVAAATLARDGARVILMEKSGHPGGRSITEELDGGYHFNLGAHALYRKGAAQRVLRGLGVKWTGALPPGRDGTALYRGRKYLFPSTPWSFLRSGLLSLGEKIEAVRVLASLGRLDAEALDHVSLREWLEGAAKSERVRQLLSTIIRITTYTNDNERLSAGAAITQARLGIEGNVDYLDHGWQTLVDGALHAAREAGVEILTGASVTGISRRQGAGYAIRLRSGQTYNARAVIIAAGPSAALSMVEGGQETELRKWAEESVPIKAACLDVALRRLPRKEGGLFTLGVDRPLYCIVHSASARLAPEGGAVIHLMKYHETGSQTDAKADREELEGVLDTAQPGWREVVAHARFLPRITVSNALVEASRGGLKGRPGPEVRALPGLYVAGDWVGQEGMLLDAAIASAHHAARLALKHLSESPSASASYSEPQRLTA